LDENALKVSVGKFFHSFKAECMLTESSFCHPISGGKQITKESTHNPAMRDLARRVDMMLGYLIGLVTAT
jgi:hypothetical protein